MSGSVDVLVAGAGPVGLTAAYELARRGVRVRVVDAAAGPATTSRAITTHPRSLETYAQMGVLDEILARGHRIAAFSLFRDGSRLARLDADYSQIPTRFPFTLMIDQVSTEEVLRAALAKQGVEVEWGVRVDTFTQDADGVDVTLSGAGADGVLRVPWLVGCDGGHSTVRKTLGLKLIGEQTETWLLADATVATDLDRTSLYWIRVGDGTCMAGPMPGENRWRMLDTVDTSYDGDMDAVAARFTRKLTAGLGVPMSVGTPSWVSVFTAQQRMVSSMRVGRCFVAGDAAHVHSPASGQGMNTGIQEAYNLGWKLAMVHAGQAQDGLLDTYSAERVPIGAQLLGSTKQATKLVALRNSVAATAMPLVFGIVDRVRPIRLRIQRKILGRVAGLGLGYEDGPLVRPADRDVTPKPGQRVTQVMSEPAASPGWTELFAELEDVRWTVLTDQRPALAYPWISVRTVTDTASGPTDLADPDRKLRSTLHLEPGDWLLIRPDGYVAARGTAAGADATRTAVVAALTSFGLVTSVAQPAVA